MREGTTVAAARWRRWRHPSALRAPPANSTRAQLPTSPRVPIALAWPHQLPRPRSYAAEAHQSTAGRPGPAGSAADEQQAGAASAGGAEPLHRCPRAAAAAAARRCRRRLRHACVRARRCPGLQPLSRLSRAPIRCCHRKPTRRHRAGAGHGARRGARHRLCLLRHRAAGGPGRQCGHRRLGGHQRHVPDGHAAARRHAALRRHGRDAAAHQPGRAAGGQRG